MFTWQATIERLGVFFVRKQIYLLVYGVNYDLAVRNMVLVGL